MPEWRFRWSPDAIQIRFPSVRQPTSETSPNRLGNMANSSRGWSAYVVVRCSLMSRVVAWQFGFRPEVASESLPNQLDQAEGVRGGSVFQLALDDAAGTALERWSLKT